MRPQSDHHEAVPSPSPRTTKGASDGETEVTRSSGELRPQVNQAIPRSRRAWKARVKAELAPQARRCAMLRGRLWCCGYAQRAGVANHD